MISCGEFQSTPSAWRETVQLLHLDMSVIFQSTPSAWRETHAIVRVDAPNYISIHSLRMEGDCRSPIAALRILHFNPLPPHGGRQLRKAFILTGEKHFNPLPPHGGRRTRWRQSAETSRHFNPLPPHGGRQSSLNIFCIFNRHFNPLPPHGGRLAAINDNFPA